MTVDEVVYTLDELHKLAEKYRSDVMQDEGLDQACGGVALDMDTEATPVNEKRERYATAKQRLHPGNNQKQQGLILTDERMRVTASGLLFSGPTAYPSNVFKVPITYRTKKYTSNEQAYQCIKAESHDNKELAKTVKEMSSAF